VLLATNIDVVLAGIFFALLILLLCNLMRRQPTGLVAACVVMLGMFLTYQLVLVLFVRYEHAGKPKQARTGNPQVKVWAEMQTGLYRCPGDPSWGKSAQGKYLTQLDAERNSFKPAHHQPCP
jgi:preprotein translocase subunit SecG